jgi:hypothetical protein
LISEIVAESTEVKAAHVQKEQRLRELGEALFGPTTAKKVAEVYPEYVTWKEKVGK